MKSAPLLLLALPLVVGCGRAGIRPPAPAALTVGQEPAPWTPPATTLPKATVDEAAFLLAHGMGDPRGGTYREASVFLGSLWGGEERLTAIHGWVLPDGKRVVAPNGLVYDVVSLGKKASVEADVKAEIDRWNAVKGPKTRFASPRGPIWGPVGIRLLLVAGETRLADRFAAVLPGDPNRYGGAVLEEFVSKAFDQAVTAHMRGGDATALRVGRTLTRFAPDYEARVLATVDPLTHAAPGGRIIKGAAFPFLTPLAELNADSERRLAAPPRGSFNPKTASVAALVDRLDEVRARQWGQPGGIDFTSDPIVTALAAKGDEAAEPLLDAMERDKRLTRSVSFGRDFFPGRNLITVREAALAAFQAFAQTDNFPAGSVTHLDVPRLRAYWQANRGKTGPERWFNTLADDRAGWRRWEEAERRLFDPRGTRRMGDMSQGPMTGAPYAEALRGRTNPSLGDLLEKRAVDILDRNDEGLGGTSLLYVSLHIATDLGRWDPPRSVPVLRTLTRRTLDALAQRQFQEDYVGSFLVPALEARAKAGDGTAWKDYAEALGKLQRFPGFESTMLRPMVEHPDVPEVREATKLLTTPGSIYDAVGRLREDPGVAGYDSIVVSPLLGLPSLFQAVTKTLDDRTVIGASWIDDRGNGWMEANGKPFPSQGVRPDPKDPKPPAGEKRPLRMADVVAHDLARLKGSPKFQPFWTLAQKDPAIRKMRAFLLANRDHIDAVVPWPNNWKTGAEEMASRK